MINATLLGAIWGLMRLRSGSVVVASLSHGVWNGLAYVLFGFSTKVGALGIENTALFGPEVGVIGLVLNSLFFIVLWRGSKQVFQAQHSAGHSADGVVADELAGRDEGGEWPEA